MVTYLELPLNVDMDRQPFSWINRCGYAGLQTVNMKTLGVTVSLAEARSALTEHLLQRLKG